MGFKEIIDWNNLSLIDYDTIYVLYRQVFKRAPQVCCSHKREPFIKELQNQPGTLKALKQEYDRVMSIHTKYEILLENEINFINGIGHISSTFITQDQIDALIKQYGNKYIKRKRSRKSKASESPSTPVTD